MLASIAVAATGQAMSPRRYSFESQGVTWQCFLRASRGISLSPGTQTLAMVLRTVEQEQKRGATGSSLPHTPGLPPGYVWTGLSLEW